MMAFNGKKVLVTGSDGFIGKFLVDELKKQGAEVITFDKSSGQDITHPESFKSLEKVDTVFHLAAVSFFSFCIEHPDQTFDINVKGTINVLEYCVQNNADLVFASSYIYGPPQYLPVDEKHPLNPANLYSRSKMLGEQLCQLYAEEQGIGCISLRFFNIYGPGQGDSFLIPFIFKQVNEKAEVVLKDLEPKRDFLFVDDAVQAYISAALNIKKTCFDVFNIGRGKSFSVKYVADEIIKLSGKDISLKSMNQRRPGEVMDTVADIKKAGELLGWTPKISFSEGLKKLF